MANITVQNRKTMIADILQDYYNSIIELASSNPDKFESEECRKLAASAPKEIAKKYVKTFKTYLDDADIKKIKAIHMEILFERGPTI